MGVKKEEILVENGEPLDNLYKHFGSITINFVFIHNFVCFFPFVKWNFVFPTFFTGII